MIRLHIIAEGQTEEAFVKCSHFRNGFINLKH